MFTFPVTLYATGSVPTRVFTAIPAAQTGLTTYTFTSASLGVAATGRVIVVGISSETTGTNFTISSVTVAGNAATSVVDVAQTDTISKCRSALYRVSLATGTSGNIVVTFAGSTSRCQIGVWALYDLVSATPNTTASNGAIDANTASFNINVPAVGLLLVAGVVFGGTGTQTLSGVASIDASEQSTNRQWGSTQSSTAVTPQAVSFSGTGGADAPRTLVAATWA